MASKGKSGVKWITEFDRYLLVRVPGQRSKSWSYGKKRTKTEAYAEAEKFIAGCPKPEKRARKARAAKAAPKAKKPRKAASKPKARKVRRVKAVAAA